MRRLILPLALLALLASPVAAKNNNPPGHDQGNGPGNSAQSNGNGPQESSPPGNGAQGGPAAPGKSGSAPGQLKKVERGKAGRTDQGEALDALRGKQALPLARIVKIAEMTGRGRVIDAKLVRFRDTLLYQLTMLDDAGHSRRIYYDAQTGNRTTIN